VDAPAACESIDRPLHSSRPQNAFGSKFDFFGRRISVDGANGFLADQARRSFCDSTRSAVGFDESRTDAGSNWPAEKNFHMAQLPPSSDIIYIKRPAWQ
jgi:hypothetical protein